MTAVVLILLPTLVSLLAWEWDRQLNAQLAHLSFGKEQKP